MALYGTRMYLFNLLYDKFLRARFIFLTVAKVVLLGKCLFLK